jgi:hypothetical protein
MFGRYGKPSNSSIDPRLRHRHDVNQHRTRSNDSLCTIWGPFGSSVRRATGSCLPNCCGVGQTRGKRDFRSPLGRFLTGRAKPRPVRFACVYGAGTSPLHGVTGATTDVPGGCAGDCSQMECVLPSAVEGYIHTIRGGFENPGRRAGQRPFQGTYTGRCTCANSRSTVWVGASASYSPV